MKPKIAPAKTKQQSLKALSMLFLTVFLIVRILCCFLEVDGADFAGAEVDEVALGDRIVPDSLQATGGDGRQEMLPTEYRRLTDAAGNVLLLNSTFRTKTAFASNLQLFVLEAEHRIGMCLYKHIERPAKYGNHTVAERILVSCGAEISYIFQPQLRYTLQIKNVAAQQRPGVHNQINFFVFFNSPLAPLLFGLLPEISYATFGGDFFAVDLMTRAISRQTIVAPDSPKTIIGRIDESVAPFYNIHTRSLSYFLGCRNASNVSQACGTFEIVGSEDGTDKIKEILSLQTNVYVVRVHSKSLAAHLHRIDP